MPLPEEIASEKERLYESSSLRDDLNDAEATVLLTWGGAQIERLAEDFPEDFEQKARFLRQLLKGINRFVGQREFNDQAGQAKYMSKVSMYLEPLGWQDIDSSNLFSALPEDKADMAANLDAMLKVLSPEADVSDDAPTDEPFTSSNLGAGISEGNNVTENNVQELENPNPHSITQAENNTDLGEQIDYGEEQEE